MPPELVKSACTVQLLSPATYFHRPTYSAETYEMPSSVMTTNRISWNFVLRLSIAASLPSADQHGRQTGRILRGVRRRLGRLRLLLVVDGAGQLAEDRAERRREQTAELVGQTQVEHRGEVRVVATD